MKRGLILIVLLLLPLVSSQILAPCAPEVKLINQDPYPAVPNEYVKVVFQVNGVNNPSCGNFQFKLLEKFPFSLRPGSDPVVGISSGVYERNYANFLLAPYELLVDKNAIDGDNELTVEYGTGITGNGVDIIKDFNITVEETRTDFEVSVKDFIKATNTLTFEILNIGESDIEALTVEIPKQDNIEIKGSNRNIVGSLDSNEDTTFNYEAIPSDGEIQLKLYYTDKVNIRRTLDKTITYDSSYFEDRKRDDSGSSGVKWFIALVIIIGAYFYWKRKKKMKTKSIHN